LCEREGCSGLISDIKIALPTRDFALRHQIAANEEAVFFIGQAPPTYEMGLRIYSSRKQSKDVLQRSNWVKKNEVKCMIMSGGMRDPPRPRF
jgi:hypothetical protein